MEKWIEILIRSIALFFFIFLSVKIMGKRQVSRMTPFQLVSYTVIAILVALLSAGVIENLAFGLITLFVWVVFSLAMDYLSMKSKLMYDWINGQDTVLIKQGKILEENLKQVRLTGDDLLRDLRSKNVFNLADVEFAVLESTGDMNVLLKSDYKPLTAKDMGRKVAPKSEPQTVILDGNILDDSLSNIGLNRGWIMTQLEGMGIDLENVFIAQVDSSGDLYIDLFDDKIQFTQPQVKELLYSNLQGTQADLMNYGLQTEDSNAKDMYRKNADKLNHIMKKLEPYLLR